MLLKNSKKESRKGDKLAPRWVGLYSIHESLGKGVYRLSNLKTGLVNKTAVNQCRLKVYLAPNSPSDTSSEAESDSDSEPKTKTQPPPKKRKLSQYWIADLDLKTSDKAIIERGRELTDRHMEAAHKVLAEQFPHRDCSLPFLHRQVPLPLCQNAVALFLKVSYSSYYISFC